MTTKPQDRKKSKDELSKYAFEYDGNTYEMKEDASFKDISTPGFIRKNRNKDETDLFFLMLETVYPEEVLTDTVDGMDEAEFKDFMEKFMAAMADFSGATAGE